MRLREKRLLLGSFVRSFDGKLATEEEEEETEEETEQTEETEEIEKKVEDGFRL